MEPWLRRRARLAPAAPALAVGAARYTFADLSGHADLVARRLATAGVGAGARVALLATPSLRTVEVIHALQRLAATLVPINSRSVPTEVWELVALVRPAVLLHDEATAPVLERPDDHAGPPLPVVEIGGGLDLVSPASPGVLLDDVDPAGAHSMVFTSGTTGRPKAACLTHANHQASATASARHLRVTARDRWLLCMPLSHVGGLAVVLRSAITGFEVLLHQRFEAEAVHRAIVDDGATIVSVVPTMLSRMLDVLGRQRYPSTLRVVLTGGGYLPLALRERARAAGVPVAPTYGLTEAASQVATGRPSTVARAVAERATVQEASSAGISKESRRIASDRDARAAGSTRPVADSDARAPAARAPRALPLPGIEICIRDADAAGIGEILVRGPTVMQGYFEDPDATRTVLRDGWLHTGDVGQLGADGGLSVVGRRADLIVTGGENVHPAEVERVLSGHPDVADVGVYGVPDDEWGERVVAAVVPAHGRLDGQALRTWSATRLAGFKVPRVVRVVAALPRTASGKLRRAELRGPACVSLGSLRPPA